MIVRTILYGFGRLVKARGLEISRGHMDLNPDTRPQAARFRLDTVSLRGEYNQQIHGTKRSLRSVEDFTEFEQRTAYFDGDHLIAAKKGVNLPNRSDQVALMAQMQNMIDFPPAPKLDPLGMLDPNQATQQEILGQGVFFGKGRCADCHPAPFYLDNRMHDLHLERFYEPELIDVQYNLADGPIKSFTLRDIKDSPPITTTDACSRWKIPSSSSTSRSGCNSPRRKRKAWWRTCDAGRHADAWRQG